MYVYSTLTNDNTYGPWVEGGGDLPTKPRRVLIYGGANRADRDNRLWTPRGVATELSTEELELCQQDPVFVAHVDAGFITVSDSREDPDNMASVMTGRSPDAPICPNDIDHENARKPEDKKLEVTINAPKPARKRRNQP